MCKKIIKVTHKDFKKNCQNSAKNLKNKMRVKLIKISNNTYTYTFEFKAC